MRLRLMLDKNPTYAFTVMAFIIIALGALVYVTGLQELLFGAPLGFAPFIGTAAAADRNTRITAKPSLKGYLVKNNTTIYKGTMVAVDSGGFLIPAANTAGLIVVGVADEKVVSPSTDTSGDKKCRVRSGEMYEFTATSITQAMVGRAMYVADDQTFDDVGTNDVAAGILVEYVSTTKGSIHIATPTLAISDLEGGNIVAGVADGYKIARGEHTTVAASDTVVTGLATVISIVATLESDPVAGMQHVTADVGDQAGTPAAGSVLIKGWKATAAGDTALIAATTFTKKVNWVAIGT